MLLWKKEKRNLMGFHGISDTLRPMKKDLLRDVSISVGHFIEYWGFKSIHGQIWAYIFLAADPVPANKLREDLRISKGLLSMSLNELKDYNVIYSAGKGKYGVELLAANPDILEGIITVLRSREKSLIGKVEQNLKDLKNLSYNEIEQIGIDPEKIKKLSKLVFLGKKMIDGFIKLDQISLMPWRTFRK